MYEDLPNFSKWQASKYSCEIWFCSLWAREIHERNKGPVTGSPGSRSGTPFISLLAPCSPRHPYHSLWLSFTSPLPVSVIPGSTPPPLCSFLCFPFNTHGVFGLGGEFGRCLGVWTPTRPHLPFLLVQMGSAYHEKYTTLSVGLKYGSCPMEPTV